MEPGVENADCGRPVRREHRRAGGAGLGHHVNHQRVRRRARKRQDRADDALLERRRHLVEVTRRPQCVGAHRETGGGDHAALLQRHGLGVHGQLRQSLRLHVDEREVRAARAVVVPGHLNVPRHPHAHDLEVYLRDALLDRVQEQHHERPLIRWRPRWLGQPRERADDVVVRHDDAVIDDEAGSDDWGNHGRLLTGAERDVARDEGDDGLAYFPVGRGQVHRCERITALRPRGPGSALGADERRKPARGPRSC